MGLVFNFPLNQIKGFSPEEIRTIENAYLVVEPSSINLSGVPSLRGNVFYSKVFWQAGAATPLLSETFNFAVVVGEDGRTYAVNIDNNAIAVAFQAKPDGVVDIEATAYLYMQQLFGGTID